MIIGKPLSAEMVSEITEQQLSKGVAYDATSAMKNAMSEMVASQGIHIQQVLESKVVSKNHALDDLARAMHGDESKWKQRILDERKQTDIKIGSDSNQREL